MKRKHHSAKDHSYVPRISVSTCPGTARSFPARLLPGGKNRTKYAYDEVGRFSSLVWSDDPPSAMEMARRR
ncbi:MAG: hypothetical protein AAB403_06015, partial [Planctomycetota bacterium]